MFSALKKPMQTAEKCTKCGGKVQWAVKHELTLVPWVVLRGSCLSCGAAAAAISRATGEPPVRLAMPGAR
jgi:hypothetical protein